LLPRRAKAADRQKILIKLLGLEVYERIGRRAGVTAEQQKQRAAVLTDGGPLPTARRSSHTVPARLAA